MADDEKKEEEKEEAKSDSKTKEVSPIKLILIISAIFLVFGGAGIFVLLKFVIPAVKGPGTATPVGNEEKVKTETNTETKDKDEMGVMYPLDSFIVNLAETGGRRFLKVNMVLELSSEEFKKEMETRTPQIRDTVLTVLSDKSFDEVYSVNGKYRIREELIARINNISRKGKIRNIYFTEFVIQ